VDGRSAAGDGEDRETDYRSAKELVGVGAGAEEDLVF
jgi:hypothetical protein